MPKLYGYNECEHSVIGITTLGDGTANVNCDCTIPGIVAVYLVKVENGNSQPLLEMPESFAFNKYINFR